MESVEDIVLKLNELLEADKFSRDEFDILIKQVKDEHKVIIKFLDFKYYNEYRLRLFWKEKIKNIKVQNFETAAKIREMEKECMSYISIRTESKIEKSAFYYDKEYLFYFYLGTAKNDKEAKENLNNTGILLLNQKKH